jgi:hypothetical protein
MKLRSSFAIALAVFAAAALAAPAQETDPSVPALSAFHEVIYPIWHTAYPDKDIAMLKSLTPQVNELAAKIYEAKLPGILREKQAKYDDGLAKFRAAVEAYGAAAKGSDDKALLDAAEVLHARYERLVRTLQPVLPEMETFHKVLYVVYHTDLPAKNWTAVRAAAPDLKTKAEAVAAAKLPASRAAKAEDFTKAAGELLKAADALAGLGDKADGAAVEAAVQKLHSRYQELEKVFD